MYPPYQDGQRPSNSTRPPLDTPATSTSYPPAYTSYQHDPHPYPSDGSRPSDVTSRRDGDASRDPLDSDGNDAQTSYNPPFSSEEYWPFAASSSSTTGAQQSTASHTGYDPIPSPVLIPPLPSDIESFLSDQGMAGHQHWGPFVPVEAMSTQSISNPTHNSDNDHHSSHRDANNTHDSTTTTTTTTSNSQQPTAHSSWAVGQNPSPVDANHAYTQPQLGFYNSSSSGIYPNAHHGSTQSTEPSSHFPTYYPSTASAGGSYRDRTLGQGTDANASRKGKGRAGDLVLEFGRDLKKSRVEGHSEFDKDIALVRSQPYPPPPCLVPLT